MEKLSYFLKIFRFSKNPVLNTQHFQVDGADNSCILLWQLSFLLQLNAVFDHIFYKNTKHHYYFNNKNVKSKTSQQPVKPSILQLSL